MGTISEQLAVQSYCFRGFKANEQVIEQVKKIGLSRIELCGVHVNFTDEKSFDSVLALYAKGGVKIVSIGVQGFKNDVANETKFFEFAKRAGAKLISCSFDINSVPACYRTAEKLADKYDINLGIHNHGGRHWLGAPDVLAHVFANTSKRIGLCLDTAWMLDSGGDPVAVAEKFADRLYGVHIKDFVFDRARKPEDVVVGTGNLNLAKLAAVMKEKAPAGCCPILEYEGDVNNPGPALRKCVEAVAQVG